MIEAMKTARSTRALLRRAGIVAGLGVVLGLGACDDSDDLNFVGPITTRAVAVFKDSTFNFATLTTFAMPDTVVNFVPRTGTPLAISRQFDQIALNRVRQNLLARGYTQISDPRTVTPSFVVLVGATAAQNWDAFGGYAWYSTWGFYSGWGWYAPGFNSTWGIVYPWFGVVGVTAYDRGTLIVDIIPTSSVNASARTVRSAWVGVATALLDGNVTSGDVNAAVDQMFNLSPYLVAPSSVFDRR